MCCQKQLKRQEAETQVHDADSFKANRELQRFFSNPQVNMNLLFQTAAADTEAVKRIPSCFKYAQTCMSKSFFPRLFLGKYYFLNI